MENFFSANPSINEALIRLDKENPFILEGLALIRQEASKIQEFLKQ
jgi:hypothetical protein